MGRLRSAELSAGSKGIPVVVVIAVGLALVVTAGFLGLTLTADHALDNFRPRGRAAEIGSATAVGPGTEILSRGASRSQAPPSSPPANSSGLRPLFPTSFGQAVGSAGVAILGLPAAVVAAAQAVAPVLPPAPPAEEPDILASGSSADPVVETGDKQERRGSPAKKNRVQSAGASDPIVSASGGPSSEAVDEGESGNRGNGHGREHQNDHDGNCPGKRQTG